MSEDLEYGVVSFAGYEHRKIPNDVILSSHSNVSGYRPRLDLTKKQYPTHDSFLVRLHSGCKFWHTTDHNGEPTRIVGPYEYIKHMLNSEAGTVILRVKQKVKSGNEMLGPAFVTESYVGSTIPLSTFFFSPIISVFTDHSLATSFLNYCKKVYNSDSEWKRFVKEENLHGQYLRSVRDYRSLCRHL